MSARNGDKSRFHRERKRKIARRTRTMALLASARTKPEPAAPKSSKPAPVQA